MKNIKAYFFILCCWSCFNAQYWQSLPSFPGVARDDAAGFVIGDELFIGTGGIHQV